MSKRYTQQPHVPIGVHIDQKLLHQFDYAVEKLVRQEVKSYLRREGTGFFEVPVEIKPRRSPSPYDVQTRASPRPSQIKITDPNSNHLMAAGRPVVGDHELDPTDAKATAPGSPPKLVTMNSQSSLHRNTETLDPNTQPARPSSRQETSRSRDRSRSRGSAQEEKNDTLTVIPHPAVLHQFSFGVSSPVGSRNDGEQSNMDPARRFVLSPQENRTKPAGRSASPEDEEGNKIKAVAVSTNMQQDGKFVSYPSKSSTGRL